MIMIRRQWLEDDDDDDYHQMAMMRIIMSSFIKSDPCLYDNVDDDICHIRSLIFLLQGPQVKLLCFLFFWIFWPRFLAIWVEFQMNVRRLPDIPLDCQVQQMKMLRDLFTVMLKAYDRCSLMGCRWSCWCWIADANTNVMPMLVLILMLPDGLQVIMLMLNCWCQY